MINAAVAGRVGARANVGRIVNLVSSRWARCSRNAVGLAVPFAAVVLAVGCLNGKPELVLAAVALVDVEVVVIAEDADQVLGVDRAAKELVTESSPAAKALDVLDAWCRGPPRPATGR